LVRWLSDLINLSRNTSQLITNLLNINDVVAKRQRALFSHVVRLNANTPAHQSLKQAIDVKSGHRPGAQWLRPPGRPRNSLVTADQRLIIVGHDTLYWKAAQKCSPSGSSLPSDNEIAQVLWMRPSRCICDIHAP